MELSITTDYAGGLGCPEPALRHIAEQGYTAVHWCHHWNDDFVYAGCEIAQISAWLRAFGLRLLDLHGSEGREKCWVSPREYERLAGVDLVANRIAMTGQLGGRSVVMHINAEPDGGEAGAVFWDQLRKSLDALEPVARVYGVRLALENLKSPDNSATVGRVLAQYPPDYVGVCYDSGHGNITGTGLDFLERHRDRLIALHLHDNDGTDDQHKLLFSGTVDWDRLARSIARSAYDACVSMEVSIRHFEPKDARLFLGEARETGVAFTRLLEAARR